MTKPSNIRLSFRLNPNYDKHQQALKILSKIPSGRMADYICDAILKKQEWDGLRELIQQAIHDEMKHYEVKLEEAEQQEDAIDDTVIDFILSLQRGVDL